MSHSFTRGRLLAGAALGFGLATLVPQQAMAACVVAATSVVCDDTTTTDTTNAGGTPASDRHYPVDTSAADFTGTVLSGEIVNGFGLAFTNTVGGANDLNVVNNGTVQVDAGNAATAGGSAALHITAIGATPVNYSGTGTVANLGTSGNALQFDMNGTGALTANVGGNLTAGPTTGGYGLLANMNGAGGTANVTTATGTTVRADYLGVAIYGNNATTGDLTLTNNATVLSPTGAPNTIDYGVSIIQSGTGNATIVNNGTLGSATDRVQIQGIEALLLNGASTGTLSVSGSGAIWGADTGIRANNTGTGTTTVNYTGPVNTTGATGVDVDATTGATNVTLGAVTAATDAVDVTSTGAQTIALNGVTTGTAGSGLVSTTTGARTITVGTGGNVAGGTQAILLAGTGTATVGNSGIIGAAASPGGLAINAAAAGATGVTNNAGGTINGRLTLSAFDDTFSNSGTWNTQGITDFGVGADALTNNAAGIINLTGATTMANLETFTQNGRINLNTFTLTGPAIAFTNNGFIDTSGSAGLAGFTSFSNAGTLDLAAGTFTVPVAVFTNTGLILADEGATTITGQTSFANSGTLDLQDGVTDDTLTIDSDFVGSGASTLAIDFSGVDADLLVINGDASGSTDVDANYVGGFNLDGVLVVDAVTSAADAFVLGSVTGATPLLDVDLVQSGADYFIVAAPTEAAFNPLVVPGFAIDLWYQSANEIFAETVKPATTSGISFWGEGYISRDKYGDDDDTVVVDGIAFDVDNQLKTKRHGLQMGVDYGFDGSGRVGLTGGYAWAKVNGNADADLKAKGWNLGIYGQFGGLTGFHGEFLAKHDRYKAKFDDGAFDGEKFDIRSTGVDGSLGYRFGMGGAATMDVHAGLSHVRTKVDDISAFGFNYDIAKLTSTRGRAGVRAVLGGGMAPYIDATVYREFKGGGDIELFDGFNAYDLDTRGKGTWARLEAGLGGNDGPGPILAAWGDFGDRKGIGLRAGWRLGGRVAEAAPPPAPYVAPPAPPPPPPATQTCPDGSVVLATDMCPPPPPPPPPPPEPERG